MAITLHRQGEDLDPEQPQHEHGKCYCGSICVAYFFHIRSIRIRQCQTALLINCFAQRGCNDIGDVASRWYSIYFAMRLEQCFILQVPVAHRQANAALTASPIASPAETLGLCATTAEIVNTSKPAVYLMQMSAYVVQRHPCPLGAYILICRRIHLQLKLFAPARHAGLLVPSQLRAGSVIPAPKCLY